jgi:hypothetical protein
MTRVLLAAFAWALVAGLAPSVFAWSVSVDAPTQFVFDRKDIDTAKAAQWKNATSNDLEGYKVALKTPFFLGVGYEYYAIRNTGLSGGSPFEARIGMQLYDVFVNLPVKFLNISLGYGQGTATTAFNTPTAPTANAAKANQGFLVLGIPLGRLDIHIGYHKVQVDRPPLIGAGSPDQGLLSGQMLSAGLRLTM